MIRDIYSIPECICRHLPDQIPGDNPLKILGTDPLRPTDLEPTTSGIHFLTSRGPLVLQGMAPTLPPMDSKTGRSLLFAMADGRKNRPLFFDKDLRTVRKFLKELGAKRLGHGADDLQKETSNRERQLSL